MRNVHRLMWPAIVAASGLLAACGGGGGGSPTGTMTLNITDAPVDGLQNVYVVFTGVELKPTNGNAFSIDFASPQTIDLLSLQNGNYTDLFSNQKVPAGHYDWVRLKVYTDPTAQDASRVYDGSAYYNLTIPSGAQTGLKLVQGFNVAQGQLASFVIDFNVRKSITAPNGQNTYFLRPALRMMNQMQVGTLTVNVDLNALATAQNASPVGSTPGTGQPAACVPGVYLFTQADANTAATPDDVDGDTTDDGGSDPIYLEPLTDSGNGTATLNIPFVDAALTYTVAATCDFSVDQMDSNDYAPNATQGQQGYQTMRWTMVSGVSVASGGTTTVALPQ